MNRFFDFHFHPLGKQFLGEFSAEKRKNDRYKDEIKLPTIGKFINRFVGKILNNQASVSQSLKSGLHFGVATIVAPELVFASRKGLLKLLEWDIMRKDVIAPLDNDIFDFVRQNRNYNHLFEEEWRFYQWAFENHNHINILNRKSKDGLQLKENRLNLIMAIEGGHNLHSKSLTMNINAHPVNKIKEYRKEQDKDFLYLTLTHLSHVGEQILCNHAFGFKLVKGVRDAFPQVNGLVPLGREVIKACMDTGIDKYPFLIDIKHMSLKGRKDFYSYRKTLLDDSEFQRIKRSGKDWWPILATHMGVTGYRSENMTEQMLDIAVDENMRQCVRVLFQRVKAANLPQGWGLDNVYFNPLTINLCDDDIEEIAQSNGLIGISLDSRILGHERIKKRHQKNEYDFFFKDEFKELFPYLAKDLRISPTALVDDVIELEVPTQESFLGFAGERQREAYLFCFNVFHIVATINKLPEEDRHGKNGWDFVCIGSDYDGLINSIQLANTATDLPGFKRKIRKYFRRGADAYREEFDYDGELFLKTSGKPDIDKCLDKLFYTNGHDFLKEWWKIQ